MTDPETYIALGKLTARVADLEHRVISKLEQIEASLAKTGAATGDRYSPSTPDTEY
jgi:hypothetical protein